MLPYWWCTLLMEHGMTVTYVYLIHEIWHDCHICVCVCVCVCVIRHVLRPHMWMSPMNETHHIWICDVSGHMRAIPRRGIVCDVSCSWDSFTYTRRVRWSYACNPSTRDCTHMTIAAIYMNKSHWWGMSQMNPSCHVWLSFATYQCVMSHALSCVAYWGSLLVF